MKHGWTSETARALCADIGEPDPEIAVRLLVERMLYGLRHDPMPVDLQAVLDELGIDDVRELDHVGAGCLLDDGSNCWIGVNARDSKRRRRFTVAHECLHFMLPTHRPGTHHDVRIGVFDQDDEEEYLCDLGASYVLIPQEQFIRLTDGKPITTNLIWWVTERFNISLEAAIVTACKRLRGEFIIAKWRCANDGFMSLERAYRSSQISSDFWLDASTRVSPSHEIARLSMKRRNKRQHSKFCLHRPGKKIFMDADYLSLGGSGSAVLSVLRPLPREQWTPT